MAKLQCEMSFQALKDDRPFHCRCRTFDRTIKHKTVNTQYKKFNSPPFFFYCFIHILFFYRLNISRNHVFRGWQTDGSFQLFLWDSVKLPSCSRCMPLSALTQSTKTAPDPFVCFIYPDGSLQFTWDSGYPFLPLLIDSLCVCVSKSFSCSLEE